MVILGQSLAIQLSYRMAFLQIAIFESIGLLGTLFYWRAAATSGEQSSGILSSGVKTAPSYTVAAVVLYFMMAASHQILQESGLSRTLSLDIRSGKLASALVRPFPFILIPLLQGLAFSLSRAMMIGPVLLILFAAVPFFRQFFVQIATAQSFWLWLSSYFLALFLAMIINLFIRIGLGLLAFDMTQTWGPDLLFGSMYFAFSGAVYPVDLLPSGALRILQWTPFYYLQGFPNLLMTGRIPAEDFWPLFLRGSIVAAVTVAVVVLMWQRGTRKFEAIGI